MCLLSQNFTNENVLIGFIRVEKQLKTRLESIENKLDQFISSNAGNFKIKDDERIIYDPYQKSQT
jgi:hypothetical protein